MRQSKAEQPFFQTKQSHHFDDQHEDVGSTEVQPRMKIEEKQYEDYRQVTYTNEYPKGDYIDTEGDQAQQ